MPHFGVLLACLLLKAPLSLKSRTKLLNSITVQLKPVPLEEVIKFKDDGTLLINKRKISAEEFLEIRESAKALLNNRLRLTIREQVASIAGKRGVLEGDTPEKLFFYRAALWFGMQEEELLRTLAGEL